MEAPSAPADVATSTAASNGNSNAPTLLELLSRTCLKRWPKPDWQCSPVLDIMLAAEFDVLRRRVQVWQSFEWDGESYLTAILNRICALPEHVFAFISFGVSSI